MGIGVVLSDSGGEARLIVEEPGSLAFAAIGFPANPAREQREAVKAAAKCLRSRWDVGFGISFFG